MITLFRNKNLIEILILLAGGLVVVVFAFFTARGDLDAYTQFLLTGIFPSEERALEAEFSLSEEESQLRSELEKLFLEEEMAPPAEITPQAEVEPPPPAQVVPQVEEPAKPASPPQVASPPQPTSPPPSSEGTYYVQAGAFSRSENAERMVNTLRELGFSAVSEPVSGLYRVRIYGFSSQAEAQQAAQKLKNEGIEVFVGQ